LGTIYNHQSPIPNPQSLEKKEIILKNNI